MLSMESSELGGMQRDVVHLRETASEQPGAHLQKGIHGCESKSLLSFDQEL